MRKHSKQIKQWADDADCTVFVVCQFNWELTTHPTWLGDRYIVIAQRHLLLWRAYLAGELEWKWRAARDPTVWAKCTDEPDFRDARYVYRVAPNGENRMLLAVGGTCWINNGDSWLVTEKPRWDAGWTYKVVLPEYEKAWAAWRLGRLEWYDGDRWVPHDDMPIFQDPPERYRSGLVEIAVETIDGKRYEITCKSATVKQGDTIHAF